MNMWIRFIKNWTLPIAMLSGALAYFFFARVSWVAPTKPWVEHAVVFLTPTLIFAQLLLTFCKVEVRELKPRRWHAWLLLFQIAAVLLLTGVLVSCSLPELYREVFEAALVCLVCPTATAGAVITAKLGGSAASLTTYTLFSNLMAAVLVPLLFPLVEPHEGLTFFLAFLRILSKVFPLLICPFLMAQFLRYFLPRLHQKLMECHEAAFYLWGVSLAIVSGQTVRSFVNSEATSGILWLIALAGLTTCVVQFYFGKRVGGHYGERISGGQSLGQKNTVLAIWMAYTYLNPLSSVGPGSYVLWQNLINSYQLWKKRKRDAAISSTTRTASHA